MFVTARDMKARNSGALPYDPTKPFNEQTREIIKATHSLEGPFVVKPDGKRFRVERDSQYWSRYSEASAVDGIGTKGLLHYRMGTQKEGAKDVFAMVADDLAESGRVIIPQMVDHIIIQREDHAKIFGIVQGLADLSKEHAWKAEDGKAYPIAIVAGETAILSTVQGFEVGLVMTGFVRKGHEITTDIGKGDVIIGLASNGVHSNGLSFFRNEIFEKRGFDLDYKLPWGPSIGEELTRPTTVYLSGIREMLEAMKIDNAPANMYVHGMVHITGGGLSKLKELINGRDDVDIKISKNHSLEPHELFRYAHREFKPSQEEMYTWFNNGIGYVIVVHKTVVAEALAILNMHFKADVIGSVTEGTGKVRINSMYENSELVF